MGGGGSTQTVQKADPWAGLQPYLLGQDGFAGLYPSALEWFNSSNPSYYPGQTVASPSWQTLNAEQRATNLATGGGDNPWTQQNVLDRGMEAQDYLKNVMGGKYLNSGTASGQYLNSNPYLDKMVDAAASGVTRNFNKAVLPGIASQFATGGRYGSGQQLQGLSDASLNLGTTLSNQSTNIYGNAYNMERQLQEAAIARERGYQNVASAALPQLAQGLDQFSQNRQLGNINLLNQVGSAQTARNQANINADVERYNYGQNLPLTKLQAFSQLLQGFGGGTTTNTQTGSGSFLSNALGAGMLGNSIYNLAGGAAGLGGLFGGAGMLGGAGGALASGVGAGLPLSFGLGAGGLFTGAAAGATGLEGAAALAPLLML